MLVLPIVSIVVELAMHTNAWHMPASLVGGLHYVLAGIGDLGNSGA
jgi:hypothetical protein